MKASIDRALCIGCGLCEEICPEVFAMGDDAIALVVLEAVPPELDEKTRDAASSCPVEAILLS